MMLTSFQIGGTERQVVNVVLGLDHSRFDVHLACIHRRGELLREVESLEIPQPEFPIHSLYWPGTWLQALRLARYIRKHRVQVVHSYGLYPNLFLVPAAKLAGAPVIIASIRDRGDILTPAQRWFQKLTCRLADCVLVNARAIRDTLIAQGFRSDNISVIRNGIVPAKYSREPQSSRIRRELRVPPDAPLIVVLSRLNPMKGLEYFLDAARMVAPRFPEARFLVVGDGRSKSELAERAAQSGLKERVLFTGFRTDAPDLLAEATLSVLPSLSEGLSNTVLESMASGVPVIATDVGGNPELIDDGVSGLLVPPRNADALAAAMIRLLKNPVLAAMLSEAARRRIEQLFGMEASVHAVERLYRGLAGVPDAVMMEATSR